MQWKQMPKTSHANWQIISKARIIKCHTFRSGCGTSVQMSLRIQNIELSTGAVNGEKINIPTDRIGRKTGLIITHTRLGRTESKSGFIKTKWLIVTTQKKTPLANRNITLSHLRNSVLPVRKLFYFFCFFHLSFVYLNILCWKSFGVPQADNLSCTVVFFFFLVLIHLVLCIRNTKYQRICGKTFTERKSPPYHWTERA